MVELTSSIMNSTPAVISAVTNSFSCDVCKKTFSANYNLTKHVKKFHSFHSINVLASKVVESVQLQTGKKCPLCSYASPFKRELILHFNSEHDININAKKLEFDNLEEFKTWLALTEKNSKSKFVKEKGTSSSEHHIVSQFVCHRSGNFISKGKGHRHVKIQSSNKIGAFCPAGIKLTVNRNNNYKVQYIDVHVGHANDLEHLNLTSLERESLAAKVAAKVPLDAILDEVRDSISHSSLERLHLLTRKDLYNIKWNMCKDTDDNTIEETTSILGQLSKNNCYQRIDDNLMVKKEQMKKTVLDLIDGITSIGQMEAFQKFIAPITPTLSALKHAESENRANNMLPSVSKIPHNKTILPQRRLFYTNNKQKTNKKRSISLPTRDKSIKIASALPLSSHSNVNSSYNRNDPSS